MRTKESLPVKIKSYSIINALVCIAFFLCSGGLCIPAVFAQREVNRDLLMILPVKPASQDIDV